ncbi:hypothetical protein MUN46_002835 [Mesosutterella sp. AGMB02718]|uniref:CCA tRNA nucleotidyltransferase n=1 Tax=Mesosutterella faecium TaxID=2925194 RepID=A0ABT7IKJ3_9BURK|nr:hypothetical protein [Mesosutterella sp. AGMB02718]MDL2058884.1 hypothetical protein [Mesosutterella sp. AGMB02718]
MKPQIFIVGGYVRDLLLKEEGYDVTPQDRDFVVVGATPQYMVQKGFLPVGADFPVFLHPRTHEEYALARTERKTGPGYHGFTFHASPEVTLEEDLERRDLTINAIAMDSLGRFIDPWGGRKDIRDRIFRHVSSAFREDPVRILRLARFSARLPDFRIAEDTWRLLEDMVRSGEADALVPERVMRELSRGLMEKKPSRMIRVLSRCGALERVIPGLECEEEILHCLDESAKAGAALPVRFTILLSRSGNRAGGIARGLRTNGELQGMADLVSRCLPGVLSPPTAHQAVQIFEKSDFFRRPERLRNLLVAARFLGSRWGGRWEAASAAAKSVVPRDVVAQTADPSAIPQAIRTARERAVETVLSGEPQ